MSVSLRGKPSIERLRQLETLHGSTDKELAQVARLSYEFVVPAGAILVREGDRPRGFFLIETGRAAVSVDGVECDVLEPGMFFGDTAIVDRGLEPATVVALAQTVVRFSTRRQFQQLTKTKPIANAMMQTLANRQRLALQYGARRIATPVAV